MSPRFCLRAVSLVSLLASVPGCGDERPPPCLPGSCGTLMERDVITIFPDLPDVPGAPDAPDAGMAPDVPVAPDRPAPLDAPDVPAPLDVPAPRDVPAPMDVAAPRDVPPDIPQDPPITNARADLGTRGLIATLPCSDVLRHLSVTVTPRTVPPNSFQLRVRNASTTDTLSVWYNATLNTEWNIENLASELRPGAEVTLDFWRSTGAPAWYVLGINVLDHFYVNRDGIFVELPCGAAARQTTQRFRATIAP